MQKHKGSHLKPPRKTKNSNVGHPKYSKRGSHTTGGDMFKSGIMPIFDANNKKRLR